MNRPVAEGGFGYSVTPEDLERWTDHRIWYHIDYLEVMNNPQVKWDMDFHRYKAEIKKPPSKRDTGFIEDFEKRREERKTARRKKVAKLAERTPGR